MLLGPFVQAASPTKTPDTPGYCAKIEQLMCNGPVSLVDPKDMMTFIALVLGVEDPAFDAAAKRLTEAHPEKKKKLLVDELAKLEGRPFVCKAFDVAWDGRDPKCPKDRPTEVREGCLVVTNSQAPVVEVKKVASGFIHGDDEASLATITLGSKGTYLATIVAGFDELLCEQLGVGSYIVHTVKKTSGLIVASVYSPIAKENPESDLRTLCAAPDLGARLLSDGTEKEKVMVGLRESWGALTTQKYRAGLFKALDGDATSLIDMVREDFVGNRERLARPSCALLKTK